MEEIELYAKNNRVPIMQKDGILYLQNYIREHNIKNILEIGTAIGYSAIMMANVRDDIRITSIEKDEDRFAIAVDNVKKYGLDDRINLILDDAINTSVDGEFDLIFIDASKGNNINFFNKYKSNLKKDGVIVTDNLSFHGLVENDSLIKTKNQKGIVNKIKLFIEFLNNNKEFDTIYIAVGDTIAISKRSDSNE